MTCGRKARVSAATPSPSRRVLGRRGEPQRHAVPGEPRRTRRQHRAAARGREKERPGARRGTRPARPRGGLDRRAANRLASPPATSPRNCSVTCQDSGRVQDAGGDPGRRRVERVPGRSPPTRVGRDREEDPHCRRRSPRARRAPRSSSKAWRHDARRTTARSPPKSLLRRQIAAPSRRRARGRRSRPASPASRRPGPAMPVIASGQVRAEPLAGRPAPSRGPPPRRRRRGSRASPARTPRNLLLGGVRVRDHASPGSSRSSRGRPSASTTRGLPCRTRRAPASGPPRRRRPPTTAASSSESRAVDPLAQGLAKSRLHRRELLLGRPRRAAREEVQLDLARRRQDRDRDRPSTARRPARRTPRRPTRPSRRCAGRGGGRRPSPARARGAPAGRRPP